MKSRVIVLEEKLLEKTECQTTMESKMEGQFCEAKDARTEIIVKVDHLSNQVQLIISRLDTLVNGEKGSASSERRESSDGFDLRRNRK